MSSQPRSLLATLLIAAAPAQASDPKATIADPDARLAKIGPVKIGGTDDVAGKNVPAIFFGERKINNKHDVVDAIRRTRSARSTRSEVHPPGRRGASGGGRNGRRRRLAELLTPHPGRSRPGSGKIGPAAREPTRATGI